MEKKQQRLDEEELSWCSWQQEGLQMVLVDAAMGGKTAANDSARITQQQQQHTQTQAADEDGVSTERDRGFVDDVDRERQGIYRQQQRRVQTVGRGRRLLVT